MRIFRQMKLCLFCYNVNGAGKEAVPFLNFHSDNIVRAWVTKKKHGDRG